MQTILSKNKAQTDIVYDDANYPITGLYQNIYTWNQNSIMGAILVCKKVSLMTFYYSLKAEEKFLRKAQKQN